MDGTRNSTSQDKTTIIFNPQELLFVAKFTTLELKVEIFE